MGLYFKINIVPLFVCVILLFFSSIYFFRYKLSELYKFQMGSLEISCKIAIACCIVFLISITIVSSKEKEFDYIHNNYDNNTNDSSSVISFIGVIVDVEKESDYYFNYIVKIKKIDNYNKLCNKKVLLKVKKTKKQKIINYKYGDMIFVKGKFQRPSVKRNYKGFDYSEYLKTSNVYMIVKSNSKEIKLINHNSTFVVNMWINGLQNSIRENLITILPKETADIASALLIGDSKCIDKNEKKIFSDANLAHVLAISGMHVSYFILGLSFLLKKFDKRKGKIVCILFLMFFACLVGASSSVVRAVIMSCILISSKLFYRKSDSLNNIAISCLCIVLINPYGILNIGFQLSFLGTLGIILFEKKLSTIVNNIGEFLSRSLIRNFDNENNKEKNNLGLQVRDNNIEKEYDVKRKKSWIMYKKLSKALKNAVVLSISANVLILPVLANMFNTFSLTFIISNLLLIPILGIMVFSGYITIIASLISINLAKIIGITLNLCIKSFIWIAKLCSNVTFLRFTVITTNIIFIMIYYLMIVYLFFFFKKKHIKVIFTAVLIIIFVSTSIYCVLRLNNGLKIYFIDVGQGDSTLIITNENKSILIDGGGSETGDYNVGENVLLPYLLDRGVMTVDYMIFSHFDADHAQGLEYVLEHLKVSNVILSKQVIENDIYKKVVELANKRNTRLIFVKSGDLINIGDVKIYILHPQSELMDENPMNNNSVLCRLEYKRFSMLFTGDIEKVAEELIINKNLYLKADILKVAHHGSSSSSIQDFLNEVKPKIALIGVGENNRYGHPNVEVLDRLRNMNVNVYRTDECGEICISINKRGKIVRIEKCISN